jgi:hypothetical protein
VQATESLPTKSSFAPSTPAQHRQWSGCYNAFTRLNAFPLAIMFDLLRYFQIPIHRAEAICTALDQASSTNPKGIEQYTALREVLSRADTFSVRNETSSFIADRLRGELSYRYKLMRVNVYSAIMAILVWLVVCFSLWQNVPMIDATVSMLKLEKPTWLRFMLFLHGNLSTVGWLVPITVGLLAYIIVKFRRIRLRRFVVDQAALLLADELNAPKNRMLDPLKVASHVLGSHREDADNDSMKLSPSVRLIGDGFLAHQRDQRERRRWYYLSSSISLGSVVIMLLSSYLLINLLPLLWLIVRSMEGVRT